MAETAIVGAAYSPVARHADRTIGQLAVESCRRALADAGLTLDDVDGISNYPNPSRVNAGSTDGVDFASVDYVSRALGLRNLRWGSSQTRGSFTGSITEAVNAVASGACEVALAWRAMYNPPGRFGRPEPAPVAGERQFSLPYGFGNEVVKWTLAYSRYAAKYGHGADALWPVVDNAHRNGARNPDSVFFGQPLDHETYLASRFIVQPSRLYDCDMPVDASSAVVITRADRARSLVERPAYVAAAVNGGFPPRRRLTYVLEDHQATTGQMVAVALDRARIRREDITHLHLYDGFAFHILFWIDALGFGDLGSAPDIVAEQARGSGPLPPLNTSGGSIGMGRLHGGAQVVEAVRQIQGRAQGRQVDDASVAFVSAGAPITGAGALVLTAEEH